MGQIIQKEDYDRSYQTISLSEVDKQETLEEVANNNWTLGDDYTEGFIKGVKWQQEQMYSEEEVKKIALDFFYHWWNSKGTNTEQGFEKWFEQFKKK